MTTIKREKLLTQLECVEPGLSRREVVEQSSCFVFQDGRVVTYNDETACSNSCDLDIEGAVQSGPLLNLLRKLTDDEIDIEVGEGELIVKTKRRRAGIRMENEILLPIDSIEKPGKWTKLPDDFEDAIKIVKECASKDINYFKLTCIHIAPNWVEAHDNLKIARYRCKTGFKNSVLVKKDAIRHLVGLGVSKFSESENWVHFRGPGGLVVSCRRYVEEYQSLNGILKTKGQPITLPKGLIEAAEIAEIFSSENPDENELLVELRNGRLKVTGRGVNGWFAEIRKIKYDGEPLSFLISPKLLCEVVHQHNECEIAENLLKVDNGKFIYVTCLGRIDDESDGENYEE